MSLPTQPDLIAKLTSGEMSPAEYREERTRREREHEAAYAIPALEAAKGVSPTLIASEVALQRESLIREQERTSRAVAERQRKEAEAQAVRDAQAKADAERRARDAAAAQARSGEAYAKARAADKAAQQRLAAEKAAIAAQQTARLQAEQARQRAEQQRVNELIEAARQKMIAEQGRVVAAEQEGRVIAEAMAQARAEQAYLAGEIEEPSEMHVPVYEEYELPVGYTPPTTAAPPGAYQPPPLAPAAPPAAPPGAYQPPPSAPAALPGAYQPLSSSEWLGSPPSSGWQEMAEPQTTIAAAPIPGVPPYLVAGPAAKQAPVPPAAVPLLIGAVVFLLTGYWIAT